MILGADIVRHLLALEGLVVLLVATATWILVHDSRQARRFLFGVVIFYAIASLLVVPTTIGQQLARGFHPFRASDVAPGSRTVLIVLGSGSITVGDWWGDNYSVADHTSAQRALEASHVYRLIHPQYVISSGGEPHPSSRRVPAGLTMRDALIALGVPPGRILVETESKTTRDEALIVAGMLEPLSFDRCIIVTSESHIRRAMGTFRAVGINCLPAMAAEFDYGSDWMRQLIPSHDGLEATRTIVHEFLGFAYYLVRGWWVR